MLDYTLADIASWIGCETVAPIPISSVTTDSHKIEPAALFAALPGQRTDGHCFLAEAAAKGARAALVKKDYRGDHFGLTLLYVEDVLGCIQRMAKKWREILQLRVIAVTGSVGKTTTKNFIATLLSARYKVSKSQGNANSQIGVPLTILNCSPQATFLVQEMGMSGPGQLTKLIEIAPPEIAIITKIGHSHISHFPDGLEGIAAAKAEILLHPNTKYCVGDSSSATYATIRESGNCEKYFVEFRQPTTPLPFTARHLVENFLIAERVAKLVGLEQEEIALQAEHLVMEEHRFASIQKSGILFFDDCYNASPESTKAALSALPATSGKRIFAFGGCGELGEYHDAQHREIAEFALLYTDHLLCLGAELSPMLEIFAREKKPAELFMDFFALKKRIFSLAHKGDVVLLKSMNMKQLWRILT
jgi:UDP-N-acetylmuramoyl-tripeptide--D-alanyl-D-alanine ligase